MFSVFFFVLFINLGIWQIHRAAWKVQLLKQQAERQAEPPRPLSSVPDDPAKANHVPVRLEGNYDRSRVFLLDNRVLQGRVGFEVLMPFDDKSSNRMVLVNRGFVPMGRTRQDMPVIPPLAADDHSVLGSVYIAATDGRPPVAETSNLGPGVTIVEEASPALAARLMNKSFYPHVVRLLKSDPNALPRYWPVTMMMPSRHRAYAVQWFLMAVAVVGAWSAFSFKRVPPAEAP